MARSRLTAVATALFVLPAVAAFSLLPTGTYTGKQKTAFASSSLADPTTARACLTGGQTIEQDVTITVSDTAITVGAVAMASANVNGATVYAAPSTSQLFTFQGFDLGSHVLTLRGSDGGTMCLYATYEQPGPVLHLVLAGGSEWQSAQCSASTYSALAAAKTDYANQPYCASAGGSSAPTRTSTVIVVTKDSSNQPAASPSSAPVNSQLPAGNVPSYMWGRWQGKARIMVGQSLSTNDEPILGDGLTCGRMTCMDSASFNLDTVVDITRGDEVIVHVRPPVAAAGGVTATTANAAITFGADHSTWSVEGKTGHYGLPFAYNTWWSDLDVPGMRHSLAYNRTSHIGTTVSAGIVNAPVASGTGACGPSWWFLPGEQQSSTQTSPALGSRMTLVQVLYEGATFDASMYQPYVNLAGYLINKYSQGISVLPESDVPCPVNLPSLAMGYAQTSDFAGFVPQGNFFAVRYDVEFISDVDRSADPWTGQPLYSAAPAQSVAVATAALAAVVAAVVALRREE